MPCMTLFKGILLKTELIDGSFQMGVLYRPNQWLQTSTVRVQVFISVKRLEFFDIQITSCQIFMPGLRSRSLSNFRLWGRNRSLKFGFRFHSLNLWSKQVVQRIRFFTFQWTKSLRIRSQKLSNVGGEAINFRCLEPEI